MISIAVSIMPACSYGDDEAIGFSASVIITSAARANLHPKKLVALEKKLEQVIEEGLRDAMNREE